MGFRVFFSFFFLRKNFHDPGHMLKTHSSEIFLDKHIWYKITHSGVLRDNLVWPRLCGTPVQEGVPSRAVGWTLLPQHGGLVLGRRGCGWSASPCPARAGLLCFLSGAVGIAPARLSGELPRGCAEHLSQSSTELALAAAAGLRTRNACARQDCSSHLSHSSPDMSTAVKRAEK